MGAVFHSTIHPRLAGQATRYVIEHSGKHLDKAIHSGIRILYSDALHSLRLGHCAPPADKGHGIGR